MTKKWNYEELIKIGYGLKCLSIKVHYFDGTSLLLNICQSYLAMYDHEAYMHSY